MESINEFYRINEELKRSGKKVSLKDRALVRVYNNKQRFRTLLWVATLIISDLALYVWHDKGKRMFPRSLGLPIILTAVHNANFLGLTPEKLKQGDWERTINSAARKKKGEHHPDVARYSGVEIIYPNVIEEKAKQLKLFLKEATLKNKTFFFDILEGIEAEKH